MARKDSVAASPPTDPARREALAVARQIAAEISTVTSAIEDHATTQAALAEISEHLWQVYAQLVAFPVSRVRLGRFMLAVARAARLYGDARPRQLEEPVTGFCLALNGVGLHDVGRLDGEAIRTALTCWAEKRGGSLGKPSKWKAVHALAFQAGLQPPAANSLKTFWHQSVRNIFERETADGAPNQ